MSERDLVIRHRGLLDVRIARTHGIHVVGVLKVFGDLFKLDLSEEVYISGRKTSATEVRKGLFESLGASNSTIYELLPETTIKFLRAFINTQEYTDLLREYEFIQKYRKAWEAAPYAPTFLTVDSVVVQSGHVLVVERAAQPGKGLWALPGGFVEQDEKLVDAAVRELCEETKISLSKAQLYGSISSKEIFDLPDRSLRGRTVTTAFLFKLADDKELPKVKPQAGEVRKVMWLPIATANKNPTKWFEDHHAILNTMLGRL
jgi:bifunctional NMN adenylyltransferase/nudix hydrolase